ncbi:MAG: histidine kinase [Zoogloeaceae bacterium]|nr:histidine kinase [Zoogloeaceae bacterium]
MPDWRNLGILLRALVGVNFLALCAVVAAFPLNTALQRFAESAVWVEPLLFLNLAVLALARDLLWRIPPRLAQGLTLAFAILSALLLRNGLFLLSIAPETEILRPALLSAAATVFLLLYFELRSQALSPRLEEARLSALNARIRPHFLFNSLNTVLALIRADSAGAERALENLAELFRAILKDSKELTPLSEEIALGRQYLELEKLRLGERLRVTWEIDQMSRDTLIPPLMLQPLLENAVYHGVEPLPEGGEIHVRLGRENDLLRIHVTNSKSAAENARQGSHMALKNIRQRLELFYDMEATLEIRARPETWQVTMTLPCRRSLLSVFE